VTGASGLEEAARAKQAVRERVWAPARARVGRPASQAPRAGSPTSPGRRRRPSGWPPWRPDRRPGWSRPTPTPPSSRSGPEPWPTASCCTWPSPLTDERPFILLDPARLEVPPRRAASIADAARAGRRVAVAQLRPVDLVVCGSVAVNRKGARVGKGSGFSDLELALLVEAGLIATDTVVATVHPLQVLEEPLPETGHDFRLDPDRHRRGGHRLPPRPPAAGDPLGAPGRGQGRRHPRPGHPSPTSHATDRAVRVAGRMVGRVGATGPGAVHRLDRGPGHRQRPPDRDRPLVQLPLRGGHRRDGRGSGRPPHPVRTHTATGRLPRRRLPVRRRPGGHLPGPPLGPVLDGAGGGPCTSRSPSDAAPYWDGCSGRCPPRWPEPPGGCACWTFPPAGCSQGSAPAAAPATDAASGTAPPTCMPSSPPRCAATPATPPESCPCLASPAREPDTAGHR
jgi:5-formyltetrahydrofolate cyclo-ligase